MTAQLTLVPSGADDARRRGDLREILGELRNAGWRRNPLIREIAADSPLPVHTHRWTRGTQLIEITYDREGALDHLRYEAHPDSPVGGLYVGVTWIARTSLTTLYILGDTIDLFTRLRATTAADHQDLAA